MVNPRAVAVANAARADLIDRIGPARVRVGAPARDAVGLAADGNIEPIAVVRPAGADDVVTALKVGRARHFQVVPRSYLPAVDAENLRDCIVLDTRSLDRAPAVDIGRQVVTVGAGVAATAIDRAARGARLCLRGGPAFDDSATIGALLSLGDPGELGSSAGGLSTDLVAATVVTGHGRIMRVGGPVLIGQTPWPSAALPDPISLLAGSEGSIAVLVDVTVRLYPSPWAAWSTMQLDDDRASFMRLLSAARKATSKQLLDTVLVDHEGRVDVRAATLRGEDDRDVLAKSATQIFKRHGLRLRKWQDESRRERLGYEAAQWPRAPQASAPMLSLHVSWPDAAIVHDIVAALTVEEAQTAMRVTWSMAASGVLVRAAFDGPAARHPLVLGGRHLLDAGAVPIGVGASLREVARARMSPSSRILSQALSRAFDPDAVLAGKGGLL